MKIFVLCLVFVFISCTNNKSNGNYYFIKGLNAYEKNNKVEALKNYKLAYSKGLKETYLLSEMAYLYTEFGDLERAKQFYIEILNKNPEDEEVINNLLEIFYREKDIANIEKYSKNILNKNGVLYIKNQFNLAYLKNSYDLARKILEENILKRRLNLFEKNYNKAFFDKIVEIYKNQEKEKLLKLLDVAYKYCFENEEFIKFYSSILVEEKEYEKAEQVLMKEIINSSSIDYFLIDLAEVYFLYDKQEKFKNIMKILEKENIKSNKKKYIELKKNKIKRW